MTQPALERAKLTAPPATLPCGEVIWGVRFSSRTPAWRSVSTSVWRDDAGRPGGSPLAKAYFHRSEGRVPTHGDSTLPCGRSYLLKGLAALGKGKHKPSELPTIRRYIRFTIEA